MQTPLIKFIRFYYTRFVYSLILTRVTLITRLCPSRLHSTGCILYPCLAPLDPVVNTPFTHELIPEIMPCGIVIAEDGR